MSAEGACAGGPLSRAVGTGPVGLATLARLPGSPSQNEQPRLEPVVKGPASCYHQVRAEKRLDSQAKKGALRRTVRLRGDQRDVALTPGMAVNAEISTGKRVIDFLLDAVRNVANQGLRER